MKEAATPAPLKAAPVQGRLVLQRCACGGSAGPAGECAECRKKRLGLQRVQAKLAVNAPGDKYEQEADRVAEQVMRMPATAPPAIRLSVPAQGETPVNRRSRSGLIPTTGSEETPDEDEVVQTKRESDTFPQVTADLESRIQALKGGGEPLPAAGRQFFESRLGHDFSRVRVHHDTRASSVANALQARAFTVGQDIAFGAGEYAPETAAGQSLLAHELTHVVQQSGAASTVQRRPVDRESDDLFPDPLGSRRSPGLDRERYRGSTLPRREALEMLRCMELMGDSTYCRHTVLGEPLPPAPIPVCDPGRSLTWADFRGTPRPSNLGAETHFHFDLVRSPVERVIQAVFDGAASWVRPRVNGNPATNGCAAKVTACERSLTRRGAGAFVNLAPPVGCAATVAADASIHATTPAECTSLLAPECNRVAALESARLLRHEQGHFDIACVLARKGTAALQGAPASQERTILTAVRTKANQQTLSYDAVGQTNHGCNAGPQATWEAEIAAGLPTVTIP